MLLRTDDSLRDLINQRAKEEHLSINKFIIKALTLYIGEDAVANTPVDKKITELQSRIESLETGILALNEKYSRKDFSLISFLLHKKRRAKNAK
jgi:hypothetical protein